MSFIARPLGRSLLRGSANAALAVALLVINRPVSAQIPIWNDEVPGGVMTGSFTLGTESFGTGSFVMPIPVGSTIHKALFFATGTGGATDEVTVEINTVPHLLNANTLTGAYNSPYGTASLHILDITTELDPTVTYYTVRISIDQAGTHEFHEFYLLIAYEQPGALPVWCDVFFSNLNSAPVLDYTVNTSRPMLTAGGVAFATFAGYSTGGWQDCEEVRVNGTPLGSYGGGDYNAASPWGASGSFLYSNSEFIGLGDDNADLGIAGSDVLSNVASLIDNGDNTIRVEYEHCPSSSPDDNHVWLMVLAYTAAPCSQVLDLGQDISVCERSSVLIDASTVSGDHLWQDGSTGSTLLATTSGIYHVTIMENDCIWSDTVVVTVQTYPAFDLGSDIELCVGEVTTLDATVSGAASYLWQDGSTNSFFETNGTGLYWASVTRFNCSASDSVYITLDSCLFTVDVPNIFTPNGDALNSQFVPLLRGVEQVNLNIFNRWGQLVYKSNAMAPIWDGCTVSGQAVPDGTYFWVLEYIRTKDNTPGSDHGSVTLLR